jgi:hypothetical protein
MIIDSLSLLPQEPETSDTETYTDASIIGPVYFTLDNLLVKGKSKVPASLKQSQYIIASNEEFEISVDVEFNKSPLSTLLMCLGTMVKVTFSFEGFGKKTSEEDVEVMIKTKKGQYKYTAIYTGTPKGAKLTPGFYEASAVVQIGPVDNACSEHILGYGYIAEERFQVY